MVPRGSNARKNFEPQSRCPSNYNHVQIRDKKYWVFFDTQGVWLHVSAGMSDLLGYPREEMIGSTVEKLRPPDASRSAVMLEKFIREGYVETMYIVRHRAGHLIHFRVTCTKLPDGCLLAIWHPFEKAR